MPEFKTSNNKEYKIETIRDSTVYAKEVDGHLSRLYYLVIWKSYFKKKYVEAIFSGHALLKDSPHFL